MPPGAKDLFIVPVGRLGEKVVGGELSLILDARKIFRAVAIEFLLRLLDEKSSRPRNPWFAEDAVRGVPNGFLPGPLNGDFGNVR